MAFSVFALAQCGRLAPAARIAGRSAGCPVGAPGALQCRWASKKKPENQKPRQPKQSTEHDKPTMSDVVKEFGKGKVRVQDYYKYKDLTAPPPEKKKKDEMAHETKGLILPEKGDSTRKSMLFKKGPSEDVLEDEKHRKKMALVEHITDPVVREMALERIEERQQALDRLDPDGFYEKLKKLQALGQPNVPAKDGTRVLVIQPRIKYELQRLRGTGEQRRNISEWDLNEAVSLVDATGTYYAAGRYIIAVSKVNNRSFFTDQGLEEIKCIMDIDCFEEVFVNTKQLSARQRTHLQVLWGCGVHDRFTAVLELFKTHSVNNEAKLQLKLAILEYDWKLMKQTDLRDMVYFSDYLPGEYKSSDDPDMKRQNRKDHIHRLMKQAKEKLAKAKVHHEELRDRRRRAEVPTVALVGYTNAGKTSLISAMCPESKVVGEKRVFATLNSTVYRCRLPSGLEVVVSDTIGFISDLPIEFMATFQTTLADALEADVVVHVRDGTHPNTEGQQVEVVKVLQQIGFSDERIENMIEARNKMDQASDVTEWQQSLLPNQFTHDVPKSSAAVDVSAKTGLGLDELKQVIDERMRTVAGRFSTTLKIPSSGSALPWLHKNAAVRSCEVSEDGSEMTLELLITSSKINKFHQMYPDVKVDGSLLLRGDSFADEDESDE